MKTKEEIRDWLLENAVDEYGYLDIQGLDFSDFEGDVDISFMKVKGNWFQESHKVKGDLYQETQEVQGNLHQGYHAVKGDYYCTGIQVKGNIYTSEPKKLLQEITTEELAELGYKLKGGK